ncbi:unnamed protein product [Clonostachys rosea f. rosea IK726]|uniref:Uncharacterized protein n=1 Tax=Clonostachys rosea f. rosea IK726 TaxID=1349383 RepID=A0ACA9TNY3_BIOOC|nr:unnamed protein product [Clonostachys rosea f. rosea IK726]
MLVPAEVMVLFQEPEAETVGDESSVSVVSGPADAVLRLPVVMFNAPDAESVGDEMPVGPVPPEAAVPILVLSFQKPDPDRVGDEKPVDPMLAVGEGPEEVKFVGTDVPEMLVRELHVEFHDPELWVGDPPTGLDTGPVLCEDIFAAVGTLVSVPEDDPNGVPVLFHESDGWLGPAAEPVTGDDPWKVEMEPVMPDPEAIPDEAALPVVLFQDPDGAPPSDGVIPFVAVPFIEETTGLPVPSEELGVLGAGETIPVPLRLPVKLPVGGARLPGLVLFHDPEVWRLDVADESKELEGDRERLPVPGRRLAGVVVPFHDPDARVSILVEPVEVPGGVRAVVPVASVPNSDDTPLVTVLFHDPDEASLPVAIREPEEPVPRDVGKDIPLPDGDMPPVAVSFHGAEVLLPVTIGVLSDPKRVDGISLVALLDGVDPPVAFNDLDV